MSRDTFTPVTLSLVDKWLRHRPAASLIEADTSSHLYHRGISRGMFSSPSVKAADLSLAGLAHSSN